MLKRSTIQHLRFSFSIFLFPVFAFACSQYPIQNWENSFVVFIMLHFFLYPASNGYNSYFDKDEGSIGGVENPLPVSKQLFWVSWLMDGIAVGLSMLINWRLALMAFVYGLVSKAYSHPAIRLKRYPVLSLVILMVFQGIFPYAMVVLGIQELMFKDLLAFDILVPATLAGIFLTGFYPLTQIYQHEEDAQRGDITMSLLLGKKGTFIFTILVWGLSVLGFYFYFNHFFNTLAFWVFLISVLPVGIYLTIWFYRVTKDLQLANFKNTHRLVILASGCTSIFFIGFFLVKHVF